MKKSTKERTINGEMNRRTLAKLFLASSFVFYGVSIFGPWEWRIYSWEGLIYFGLINVLFFIGLLAGIILPNVSKESKVTKIKEISLSRSQKSKLLVLSSLSVLCWLYEMFQLIVVNSGSFVFMAGAGQAEEYLNSRTIVDQVALVLMQLGVGSYIIYHLFSRDKSNFERTIIAIGFWAAGIYLLTYGQRFALAVDVLIFISVWKINGGNYSSVKSKLKTSKSLQYLVIIIVCLIAFVAFLYVFDTRLHVETPYKYEFISGDMTLKPFWQDLYYATNGAIDPLLMLADYMGEAPYVFSGIWAFFQPDQTYWFYQLIRPITQFASAFGFPSYTDIVNEIAGPAKYSGMAYSLILNFGITLAPFASFFIGFAFSEIERFRLHSPICAVLYPCCIAATLFAPIYFVVVGRLDYVVYGIFLIYIIIGRPKYRRSAIKSCG